MTRGAAAVRTEYLVTAPLPAVAAILSAAPAEELRTVPVPSPPPMRRASAFAAAPSPSRAPPQPPAFEPAANAVAGLDDPVSPAQTVALNAVASGDDLPGRHRLLEAIAEVGRNRVSPPKTSRAPVRALVFLAAAALLGTVAWFWVERAPVPPAAPPAVVPGAGTQMRDCPTCPTMTVLPTGRFRQGSARTGSGASSFARPQHWVTIGRPLAMSTNPATVKEFSEFVAATGRDMQGCETYDGHWKLRPANSWKDPGFVQTGTHPVTCASWNDADAYARWLSAKTGHRYRLPSAAEWEYAARAGGDAAQPWKPNGSDACAYANVADISAGHRYPGWLVFGCADGYVYTSPVGSFKPNAFGLNDMLGNVFQWTQDCWHADYAGAPQDGSARADGDCSQRELRGGSWFSVPAFVRADYRNHFAADYRTSSAGIRLIREIQP
jgi:sulfatase modifying factor 1